MIAHVGWALILFVFAVFAVFGVRQSKGFFGVLLATVIAFSLAHSGAYAFSDMMRAWAGYDRERVSISLLTAIPLLIAFPMSIRWLDNGGS
ncbi:MAG: hypothetical protein QNI84_14030 [Henriciella sp.]|nr:hypothetical protein [Henriciella sp.]